MEHIWLINRISASSVLVAAHIYMIPAFGSPFFFLFFFFFESVYQTPKR